MMDEFNTIQRFGIVGELISCGAEKWRFREIFV